MDTPGCIINGYLAVLTVRGQTIAAGLSLYQQIENNTMSQTLAQTCPRSKDSIINNKVCVLLLYLM